MIERLSKTNLCCKMCNNWLLMSSFLVALSWRLSTGANDMKADIDRNTLTISPVHNLYSTTKSQLHILKLADDDVTSVNNTFILDALPMPIVGCQDSWTKADLSLSNKSTLPPLDLDISQAPHFSHVTEGGAIRKLHLCVWETEKHEQRFEWTHDNYCFIVLLSIFNDDRDNICPDNFYRDTLFTEYHTFEFSSRSARVTVDRCCRSANAANALIPPIFSSPFYLLSGKNGTCPIVEGSITSTEILGVRETGYKDGVQLCYYEKGVTQIPWTLEEKVELSVYAIVLGTPTATLLVVCLCQIKKRSTKRKFAYRQSRISSNNTQASVMFRQSTHHPPMDHQPSSSSLLNERKMSPVISTRHLNKKISAGIALSWTPGVHESYLSVFGINSENE